MSSHISVDVDTSSRQRKLKISKIIVNRENWQISTFCKKNQNLANTKTEETNKIFRTNLITIIQ